MNNDNPLIVQGDRSLLLDVHAPLAEECRNALIPFAELEKSPEHLHTYKLTPLSLWNAASAGFSADDAVAVLEKFARYDVPQAVVAWIKEVCSRFGKIRLLPYEQEEEEEEKAPKEQYLLLVAQTELIYKEIGANTAVKKLLFGGPSTSSGTPGSPEYAYLIKLTDRGTIKQLLLEAGWPVKDEVALTDGEPLEFNLRETTAGGSPLVIRDYQIRAAKALVGDKGPGTGFGTIVLPCGSGKTIVGMQVMDMLKTSTLIITTNISAVHQWIDELLDKTNLTRDDIAEYTGENKDIYTRLSMEGKINGRLHHKNRT